jgi:SAM-dependent methyltransferase
MATYAHVTLKDRNSIKRLLQRRRLHDALACLDERLSPRIVIDFCGGAGELSKRLAVRFPEASIYCYEPCPWYLEEARENFAGMKRITLVPSADLLPKGTCDLLYCNEVFEHFPPAETERAIDQILELLNDNGVAVIGVPIEVFVPALLKGAFRMTRRYGAYDARWSTVLRASLGLRAKDRPVVDMGPGPFHLPHLGFDHRPFKQRLEREFTILRTRTSPIPRLGTFLNNEIYYVVRKMGRAGSRRPPRKRIHPRIAAIARA